MKSSFYEIFDKEQGESSILSTPNAATHGRFRRLMANSTSESSIKQVEGFVQSKVDLTLQRMEEDMREHGYVDVLKWWTYMATDVSAHLSFGESFRMLEQKKVSSRTLSSRTPFHNVPIANAGGRTEKPIRRGLGVHYPPSRHQEYLPTTLQIHDQVQDPHLQEDNGNR